MQHRRATRADKSATEKQNKDEKNKTNASSFLHFPSSPDICVCCFSVFLVFEHYLFQCVVLENLVLLVLIPPLSSDTCLIKIAEENFSSLLGAEQLGEAELRFQLLLHLFSFLPVCLASQNQMLWCLLRVAVAKTLT